MKESQGKRILDADPDEARVGVHASCGLFFILRAAQAIRKSAVLLHSPKGCAYGSQEMTTYFHGCGSPSPTSYRIFTTAINETDVITGGIHKVEQGIRDIYNTVREYSLFPEDSGPPEIIFVFSSCATDLIGDDIKSAAKKIAGEIEARVVAVPSAGYTYPIFGEHYMETLKFYDDFYTALINELMVAPETRLEDSINIIGEHRTWRLEMEEVESPLKKLGIGVNCVLTAGSSVEDIRNAPRVRLNALRCEGTGLTAARLMEEKFGTPYYNLGMAPMGINTMRDWVVNIGTLMGKGREAEELAGREVERAESYIKEAKEMLKGKRVGIFSNPGHSVAVFKFCCELGMEPVIAGSGTDKGIERIIGLSEEFGVDPVIQRGAEGRVVEETYSKYRPDLIIGGSPEMMYSMRLGLRFLHIMRYEEPWYGFNGAVKFVRDLCRALGLPEKVSLPPEIAEQREKVYGPQHKVWNWQRHKGQCQSGAKA